MTDQTRGNLWIPEVKIFFVLGLHLKTRDRQTVVMCKSDRTRRNLWVPEMKSFSFYLPLVFNIHYANCFA